MDTLVFPLTLPEGLSSDYSSLLKSWTAVKEITMDGPSDLDAEANKRRSTDIIVVLERTDDHATTALPFDESPHPSTQLFSHEQKHQVEALMSAIHEREEIEKRFNEHELNHPSTVNSNSKSKAKHKPKSNHSHLRVHELRELCKTHNLATDGLKDVLIKRLQKNKIL